MGRIKSTLIKKTAKQMLRETSEAFTESFEHNKNALRGTMPSTSIRNKVAGYLARLKKMQKAE
jgi:small subunit ribosomal protein S17e